MACPGVSTRAGVSCIEFDAVWRFLTLDDSIFTRSLREVQQRKRASSPVQPGPTDHPEAFGKVKVKRLRVLFIDIDAERPHPGPGMVQKLPAATFAQMRRINEQGLHRGPVQRHEAHGGMALLKDPDLKASQDFVANNRRESIHIGQR